MKRLVRFISSAVIGVALGLTLSYNIPQANAAVGAIFDTINRGYFVSTGAYNMTIGTNGTGSFSLIAAGTPVASIGTNGITLQTGKSIVPVVYVPTPASTPVTGTNSVVPGVNVIPTTAANNAVFLGAATPIPGQSFVINNSNTANAVRIKANGGATLNGATAGGYITLAALATVHCYTASATNQICMQPVIPTPAGP